MISDLFIMTMSQNKAFILTGLKPRNENDQ